MKLLNTIRNTLRGMPWGIRFLTLLCCWVSLCIPLAFVPFPPGSYVVNGEHISFIEFWRRGFGVLEVGIGCIAAVMAYGLFRAHRWSRVLFTALVSSLVGFSIFADGKVDAGAVLSGGCFLAFVFWYFFRRRQVREYFGESRDKVTS